MDVKDAVHKAKEFLVDLLADEDPSNIGLEEVEYDDQERAWLVTLGFSRPWNSTRNTLTSITGESAVKRAYRTLKISDETGKVASIKRRDFAH